MATDSTARAAAARIASFPLIVSRPAALLTSTAAPLVGRSRTTDRHSVGVNRIGKITGGTMPKRSVRSAEDRHTAVISLQSVDRTYSHVAETARTAGWHA